jgi:hypothetical protein
MRFGLMGLIALVGLSAATPAMASELSKKNTVASNEARQMTGAIIRSQQAYYLDEVVFASRLQDLKWYYYQDSTPNYNYKIISSSQPDKYVMVTATPKRRGLPTYLGLVNIAEVQGIDEMTALPTLCRSTRPQAITVNWNMIVLPKRYQGFVCPPRFQQIKMPGAS